MARKYDLERWRAAQEIELIDNRTRPPKRLGTIIHVFGGWTWTDVRGIVYRTNMDGCGLFRWNDSRLNWVQVAGTCQFSLPSNRAQALRKLNRDPQYAVARIT